MRPFLLGLAAGLAAAAVGLVPWLVTGLRLPLQNLGTGTSVRPEDQPIVLLPFSQYQVVEIAALLVVGAALAGVVGRAVPALRRPSARVGLVLGVLVVQVGAVVQTALAVRPLLQVRAESFAYLALITAGAVASVVAGVVILVLVAAAPAGGALVGFALVAVLAGSWVDALAGRLVGPAVYPVTRWVPSVVLGVAIAWAGLNRVGRVLAALFGLVVLWLGPALVTAVVNALGSRVLLRYPAELADTARGIFLSAATIPEVVLPPLLAAVVIAAVGLLLRRVLQRQPRPGPLRSPSP